MKLTPTKLNDCFILEPKIFGDDRGFFFESFNQKIFNELTKTNHQFVQDNHSKSGKNVLRGLHYQKNNPQGKLVRVTSGSVFDVAVDIRSQSETAGQWFGIELSAENKKQLWVPPGFAHGFLVLSETAEFLYKTTDYYYPEFECCIAWNDVDLNIDWGLSEAPKLSTKDQLGVSFKNSLKDLKDSF